jgi:hypothetical protein
VTTRLTRLTRRPLIALAFAAAPLLVPAAPAVAQGLGGMVQGTNRPAAPAAPLAQPAGPQVYVDDVGIVIAHKAAATFMIVDVVPDGPAARAGLRAGQEVWSINGMNPVVEKPEMWAQLFTLSRPGDPVEIGVPAAPGSRDEKTIQVQPDPLPPIPSPAPVNGTVTIDAGKADALVTQGIAFYEANKYQEAYQAF